jgi:hypothetical protein
MQGRTSRGGDGYVAGGGGSTDPRDQEFDEYREGSMICGYAVLDDDDDDGDDDDDDDDEFVMMMGERFGLYWICVAYCSQPSDE